MWVYWMMFIVPMLIALAHRENIAVALGRDWRWNSVWAATLLVITVLIGYRFEVGGDWFSYFEYLYLAETLAPAELLSEPDPGYQILNWLSLQFGWGVFGVNLVAGLVFSAGLVAFCRSQHRPWLALAVAMPYMVIVVSMGYSRQGIALGFAMLGLVALGRGSPARFVAWVLLGATFHKSAVLLLPIAALAATRSRYLTAVWVGVTALFAYQLLLEESVESLITNYLLEEYASEGAAIRLGMNALPAIILLTWRARFGLALAERRLWTWFALFSIALLALFPVVPSSTALDRVALYLLPLQVVVFSRVPEAFGKAKGQNSLLVGAVLAYYAAVLFVWLNYAVHAQYWIPYRFYPLEAWT
jgi:hypothetical protein